MWRAKAVIALCIVGSFFILATQPEQLAKKYGDNISAAHLKEKSFYSRIRRDGRPGNREARPKNGGGIYTRAF
jgi:hypothetical protein